MHIQPTKNYTMKRLATILFIPAFAFGMLVSCGGGGKEYADENEESDEATEEMAAEEAPVYSGETAVGVVHSVADFGVWKEAYEKVSNPDGRIAIYENVDNPGEIVVFELTTSHADSKAMFSSSEMKEDMENAGVTSEPVITYYDMKYMNSEDTDARYRVAIQHEVSDYAAWRTIFDDDESRRTEAGLELRGLATDPDNANLVFMVFSTDDLEGVKSMLNDPDLKAKMEEAGVISEAIVTYWQNPGDSN